MARLRSPVDVGETWTSGAVHDPLPDPSAKRRNGRYRGNLPVRQLGAGVSGKELGGGRPTPQPGQAWRRGDQLVRVMRLEKDKRGALTWIVFREVTHGKAVRRMRVSHFMRTSHLGPAREERS